MMLKLIVASNCGKCMYNITLTLRTFVEAGAITAALNCSKCTCNIKLPLPSLLDDASNNHIKLEQMQNYILTLPRVDKTCTS